MLARMYGFDRPLEKFFNQLGMIVYQSYTTILFRMHNYQRYTTSWEIHEQLLFFAQISISCKMDKFLTKRGLLSSKVISCHK